MSEIEIDRIIEMAWEDRTPFEAIKLQFGKNESDVIKIMRKNLKPSSFKLWRKRVQGRKTKPINNPTIQIFSIKKCDGKTKQMFAFGKVRLINSGMTRGMFW